MRASLILPVLALAAACSAPSTVMATTSEEMRPVGTIVVEGVGEARARPDMATIQLGVETNAETAGAAVAAASQQAAATLAALSDAGIAAKDIQTSSVSVNARYDYGQNRAKPRITGYTASNRVSVTIRDVDRVGDVLDKALGAGANTMNSLSFGFADQGPLLETARKNAVADARSRAKTYADAAGVKVGAVMHIADTQASIPSPQPMMRAEAMSADSSMPISVGESGIEARVTMIFAID